MNLTEQLKAKRIESEARRDKIQVETMRRATEQLLNDGVGNNALGVGDTIPPFALPNAHGRQIKIADLLERGPIILTFYRGGWCPYCNLELRAYQKNLAKIKSHGAQVVAVSPELPDQSLSNKEKLALDFQVLSDVGNAVAENFGLVFQMPNNLAEVYQQLNCDITKHNGDETWKLPVPATYLVAPDHRIIFSYVNADYLKRVDPQQVLMALIDWKLHV